MTRERLLRRGYLVAAAVTSASGAFGWRRTHAVSKAVLVPLLMPGAAVPLRVALAGAWAGDLALLPPAVPEDDVAARRRLRRGAAAFAVQQAGYLALLRGSGVRPRAQVAVPVGAWLGALAVLDARRQGGRPDVVVTGYGVLLGAVTITAMSGPEPLREGGAWFLASDSTILLRELLLRRPATRALAEGFVLASYALAQRRLVDGLR